ncbi:MAG: NAD(P)-dependent alcohol dehydrogenase [Phycisphaerales bacterium]|nr:NAD(P)-dependent alcohol dehydrogenase [Phycisphaerales bacterium]
MKSAVYRKYGPPSVVSLEEVETPKPSAGEVLVKVHSSSVTTGDARMRRADFGPALIAIPARLFLGVFGPRKRVLGTGFAGVIQAVGDGVEGFTVGDRVFGSVGMEMGAHAEYAVFMEGASVVRIPHGVGFEDAASAVFGGITGIFFLREQGKLDELVSQGGARVMIVGASGGVGSMAVQYAKHLGAHVTGVCSTRNVELVESLGADSVIDYTRTDFLEGDERYDLIFDTVGKCPFGRARRILTQHGRVLEAELSTGSIGRVLWSKVFGRQKMIGGVAFDRLDYVETIAELLGSGAFVPVIDRVLGFEQIQEAHERVDQGGKVGSVMLRMVSGE